MTILQTVVQKKEVEQQLPSVTPLARRGSTIGFHLLSHTV